MIPIKHPFQLLSFNYFFFVKVSAKYLAVGTKCGSIFYYNLKENSHSICAPIIREKKIPVTCIDISYDEEIIGCGLSNGYIAFYDIQTSKLIKYFYSIHSPNVAILALKFYHNNTKSLNKFRIISTDNEGKVYKSYFDKNIFNGLNSESFPIIEKNAGNITKIKILKSYILSSSESTKNITIVALASNIKVCVIQIEPKHSVIYVLPKPSFINEIYSPSIAWDEGLFRYHEKKPQDKSIFLLICWEKYIDLLAFKENFDEKEDCFSLKCSIVGSMVLNIAVIYMTFISFNLIVGFSENSQFFLLYLDDIKESDESLMKKEEFKESFLFEIKSFLQINKKLLKSENDFLCVNSKKDENSLYFIDKEENFEVLEVFSWQKFVNKLNEIDRKMAIYKAFEIYEHGNIDFIALIPKSSKFRKKNMKEFIRTIMKNHLIFCLDDEKWGFNEEKVKEATKIIIDFVVRIEEFDFFFQEIAKIFKDRTLLNVLFVCLEKYIENEKFRYFWFFAICLEKICIFINLDFLFYFIY